MEPVLSSLRMFSAAVEPATPFPMIKYFFMLIPSFSVTNFTLLATNPQGKA
jgi:hypothetical protein